jgi:hypothetical protein
VTSLVWNLLTFVHDRVTDAYWHFMFWAFQCAGIDLAKTDFSGFGGGGDG